MDGSTKELEDLRDAAHRGDAEAQLALGTGLASGQWGFQDFEEASSWLRQAAGQGNTSAMYNLGIMHEKGLGGEADPDEAALWFWQASEQGDSGAKRKLGTMLIKGRGFTLGSPVVRAIMASAEKGHPYARSFLGKLHLEGLGVDQDDRAAEKWFRLAAGEGEESAVFNLGELVAEGRILETSEDELAEWFYRLGRIHLGRGDLVKAFDCLVSIKRIDPGHFLASRLEAEIEKANREYLRND